MSQALISERTSKSSIKGKFLEIYRTKPLGQISVKEIADACNLSRSTFYFYFEDINGLYQACEQDAFKYMETHLPDFVLYTVARDADRYTESIVNHMKMLQQQQDLFTCLLNGSEGSIFRDHWFDMIYQNCEKTISFSRTTSREQRENLIRFFAAGKLNVLANWILSGCQDSPENIALVSAQVLFQGVYGLDVASVK